nr:LysR family transcriptional regulator [Gluconobacter cerinus]
MIDWDDVRYFLAVARGGSVRSAANRLKVNHSTVLRRIAQLEERLGAQIFEKLPAGYRLTLAGREIIEFATQMEASSHQLETRVLGRDQTVRGLLRVTLPPFLATHLLMPDLAEFSGRHPDIEMNVVPTGAVANLTNRDADVAIRIVLNRDTLPLNLHGLIGPVVSSGISICLAISSSRGALIGRPPYAGSSQTPKGNLGGRARERCVPLGLCSERRMLKRKLLQFSRGLG